MDYDIGITGLTVPPTSATKSTYRPAVSVRNNGIHDALASGVLRIYAAGQLIFTSEIYSPTIAPGETKDAQAVDYWTPEAEGTYMVIADASTPLDQYEPNNHLNPTTIIVTGEPPPPPTPVTPHASQHEDGGLDEVSIDGLKGRTADQQEPLAHATRHQAGGTDPMNVGGLLGELADPQPTKAHGNGYHTPSMATSAELAAHIAMNPVHSGAENLANRETSGPLIGLLPDAQLYAGQEFPTSNDHGLRLDRTFGQTRATRIGSNRGVATLLPGAGYTALHDLIIPAKWQGENLHAIIRVFASIIMANPSTLDIRIYYGAAAWITFQIAGHTDPAREAIITAYIYAVTSDLWGATLEYKDDSSVIHTQSHDIEHLAVAVNRPAADRTFTLSAQLTGAPGDMLTIRGATALNLSAQP